MKAQPPYDWGPDYPYRRVWTGWGGVYKWIDRDGSVHTRPILPREGDDGEAGREGRSDH